MQFLKTKIKSIDNEKFIFKSIYNKVKLQLCQAVGGQVLEEGPGGAGPGFDVLHSQHPLHPGRESIPGSDHPLAEAVPPDVQLRLDQLGSDRVDPSRPPCLQSSTVLRQPKE